MNKPSHSIIVLYMYMSYDCERAVKLQMKMNALVHHARMVLRVPLELIFSPAHVQMDSLAFSVKLVS